MNKLRDPNSDLDNLVPESGRMQCNNTNTNTGWMGFSHLPLMNAICHAELITSSTPRAGTNGRGAPRESPH
jgi:hypothetical protein